MILSAGLLLLALAMPSVAADAGKEKTIKGEAKCAKCMLKEGDKCQTVVEVEAGNGKTTKYYLVENDVSKAFHEEVCKATKKVTVTGTDKRENDKHMFTATKIEPEK